MSNGTLQQLLTMTLRSQSQPKVLTQFGNWRRLLTEADKTTAFSAIMTDQPAYNEMRLRWHNDRKCGDSVNGSTAIVILKKC
ncbi:hypothetical protein BaRGS_00027918 [Batillaria attramentaria]|uniref:Uncharacterized protein n=1 Tax=Batillaria attramentaria TaxID=370345 RepID=A0ABD0K0I1_9CAEN